MYNTFDAADMEKLDKNNIILSGNELITHELHEQIEKDRLGLQPVEGTNDKNFKNSHIVATNKERLIISNLELVEEHGQINEKVDHKLYYDKINKKMYGISIDRFIKG